MRSRDNLEELIARAARANMGSRWQHLPVGTRVKAVGRPRLGTVTEIVEVDEITQVTTRVQVRWHPFKKAVETWPTDCLVIVHETEESA